MGGVNVTLSPNSKTVINVFDIEPENVKDEITEALKEAELTTKYIETKMAEYKYHILITYILFKNGFSPISSLIAKCSIEVCILFARLYLAKKYIRLSVIKYIKYTLAPILLIILLSCVSIVGLEKYLFINDGSIVYFIKVFTCFILIYLLSVWFIGINKKEKRNIKSIIIKGYKYES